MAKKRKQGKKLHKLHFEDATPIIIEKIQEKYTQQQIANYLCIDKSKMSRWIAKLIKSGNVREQYRTSVRILEVAKPIGMCDKATPIKEIGDIHKFIVNYKIDEYGRIPKKAEPVEMNGWTQQKLKMKDCFILMNTKQIQIKFRAGVPRYYQNKYKWTNREAENELIQIAEDRMREFLFKNQTWKIDFTSRKVGDSEDTVKIKEFIGISGKRSKHYKSIHGDGTAEGKHEDILSLTETIRAMKDMPERLTILEKGMTEVLNIQTRSVEALEKLVGTLNNKPKPSKAPMTPTDTNYIG